MIKIPLLYRTDIPIYKLHPKDIIEKVIIIQKISKYCVYCYLKYFCVTKIKTLNGLRYFGSLILSQSALTIRFVKNPETMASLKEKIHAN